MQHLEVSGAVRLIYKSLGVKGLKCQGRCVYEASCKGKLVFRWHQKALENTWTSAENLGGYIGK